MARVSKEKKAEPLQIPMCRKCNINPVCLEIQQARIHFLCSGCYETGKVEKAAKRRAAYLAKADEYRAKQRAYYKEHGGTPRWRRLYYRRIEAHQCVSCGTDLPENYTFRECPDCKTITNMKAKQRIYKMTSEEYDAFCARSRERYKAYTDNIKQQGICARCRQPLPPERIGKLYCKPCSDNMYKASAQGKRAAENWEKRKEKYKTPKEAAE